MRYMGSWVWGCPTRQALGIPWGVVVAPSSDSVALQLEETLQLRTESRQGSLRGDSLRGDSLRGDSLRGTSICSAMVSSAFGVRNTPGVSVPPARVQCPHTAPTATLLHTWCLCRSLPGVCALHACVPHPRALGCSRGTEYWGVHGDGVTSSYGGKSGCPYGCGLGCPYGSGLELLWGLGLGCVAW